MSLARTLLRLLLGGLFIGHGTQKLFGWFGGPGLDGTTGFFDTLGLRPARRAAILAGASEAGGGALLAAGLLTPVAAGAIVGSMTEAIRSVHAPKGPWVSNGGWEYNAVIVAAVAVLAEAGPGPLSLDHALGIEHHGVGWALAALAAGAVGPSLLVTRHAPGEAAAAS